MAGSKGSSGKCLACYGELADETGPYHAACCRKLFGKPTAPALDYDLVEMEELAGQVLKSRFAVTGVQPKISVDFEKTSRGKKTPARLTIVGLWGAYILKPPTREYPHMPEIEDLTMRSAEICEIPTADHGLIRLKSGELAYIARRFDRHRGQKLAMEDFCQLSGQLTENKYRGSLERAGDIIQKWSSNVLLDAGRFLDMAIHSFITGNADMHLKNFSLLTDPDGTIHLAPAYDLLSTKLLLEDDKEEMALPINGRKNNLRQEDFTGLGRRLGIPDRAIENTFARFGRKLQPMMELVQASFAPPDIQTRYIQLIKERCERIGIEGK